MFGISRTGQEGTVQSFGYKTTQLYEGESQLRKNLVAITCIEAADGYLLRGWHRRLER